MNLDLFAKNKSINVDQKRHLLSYQHTANGDEETVFEAADIDESVSEFDVRRQSNESLPKALF